MSSSPKSGNAVLTLQIAEICSWGMGEEKVWPREYQRDFSFFRRTLRRIRDATDQEIFMANTGSSTALNLGDPEWEGSTMNTRRSGCKALLNNILNAHNAKVMSTTGHNVSTLPMELVFNDHNGFRLEWSKPSQSNSKTVKSAEVRIELDARAGFEEFLDTAHTTFHMAAINFWAFGGRETLIRDTVSRVTKNGGSVIVAVKEPGSPGYCQGLDENPKNTMNLQSSLLEICKGWIEEGLHCTIGFIDAELQCGMMCTDTKIRYWPYLLGTPVDSTPHFYFKRPATGFPNTLVQKYLHHMEKHIKKSRVIAQWPPEDDRITKPDFTLLDKELDLLEGLKKAYAQDPDFFRRKRLVPRKIARSRKRRKPNG
jgi:hypothetical protein